MFRISILMLHKPAPRFQDKTEPSLSIYIIIYGTTPCITPIFVKG